VEHIETVGYVLGFYIEISFFAKDKQVNTGLETERDVRLSLYSPSLVCMNVSVWTLLSPPLWS
jgi:hypothetical protein